jgi:FkbM family methyltransferase
MDKVAVKLTHEAFGDFKILAENDIQLWRAKTTFTKEPGTIKWLLDEVKKGDLFIDVGANIGIYTVLASKLVGKNGQVCAIEPHIPTAHALIENIKKNNLDNVIILTTPLYDLHNKIVEFNYFSLQSGMSGSQLGHTFSENMEPFVPELKEIKLTTTLDALFFDLHVFKPKRTHIKIDVDGNEKSILQGAKEILEDKLVHSFQIECHYKNNIPKFMKEYGYHLSCKHYTSNGQHLYDKLKAENKNTDKIVYNGVFKWAKKSKKK